VLQITQEQGNLLPVAMGRSTMRPVRVSKKAQDSVALYPHRLRVDHSSVRKLQEVLATVEALKQQRPIESDD
jgi:hypothetical protein